MTTAPVSDAELLARADAAAERAYAPYSRFHVGCAVLAGDGRVIEGVNVENASYPLGVCAERTAFSRALAEGYRPGDFVAAAITASPCGGCRQWLLEMRVPRVVFRNGGRVVFRTRFSDYTGKWIHHCHILMHEDMGMMQEVECVATAAAANPNPKASVASHGMTESEVNAIYPRPSVEVGYRQSLSFEDRNPETGQVFPGFELEVPVLKD